MPIRPILFDLDNSSALRVQLTIGPLVYWRARELIIDVSRKDLGHRFLPEPRKNWVSIGAHVFLSLLPSGSTLALHIFYFFGLLRSIHQNALTQM